MFQNILYIHYNLRIDFCKLPYILMNKCMKMYNLSPLCYYQINNPYYHPF